MHYVSYPIWLLLVFVFSMPTNAAPISPNAKNEIEQAQQERLQALEESERALKNLSDTPQFTPTEKIVDEQCFQIEQIQFIGNTLLSHDELVRITQFQPACLGISTLNNYLRLITNSYVELGYVTSRAFLAPQDLSGGTLELIIIEGKVSQGVFNQTSKPGFKNIYPFQEGELLNLRQIEQGLDQINRLQRYNAQVQILPDEKEGYSIVDIRSPNGNWISGNAGYHNGGSENTGENQLTAYVEVGNLMDLFERWTLSASKSADYADDYDSESLNFGFDLPKGDWNISYRSGYSSYLTTFIHNTFPIASTGQTNTHDLSVRYLFHRDSVSKVKLNISATHRRDKNLLMGALLENSSRNLSHVVLGVDYSTRIGAGFFTVYPQYSMGTDWFGGEETNQHGFNQPQAQFEKASLTLSYSTQLFSKLTYRTTMFGQWSDDTLYGSQRLSIGGQYSVRGFNNGSISGDRGYYWRNEINYPLGKVDLFDNVVLELALDTGSMDKDEHDMYERGSMLGSAATIKTYNKKISTILSVGVPLQHPSRINPDQYSLYYNINFAF